MRCSMRKQCSCGCIHSLDGLSYFPFLDKFLCLFLESRQHFYNQQVAGYHNNDNSCTAVFSAIHKPEVTV